MPGSRDSSVSDCLGESRFVTRHTHANLVHDGDTSILGGLVELHHGGRDVTGGDDILLLTDGGLDDEVVEDVGDQADDEVVLGNLGVESGLVLDVDGDGSGALDALAELLSGVEGTAGYSSWL